MSRPIPIRPHQPTNVEPVVTLRLVPTERTPAYVTLWEHIFADILPVIAARRKVG